MAAPIAAIARAIAIEILSLSRAIYILTPLIFLFYLKKC
jgi:hypothetical protein